MSSDSAVTTKAKDWHASKHIGKRARFLLDHPDEEIPSDVTFLVGDGQNEPQRMFRCHKFLLAMASAMFQTMFYGSFPQTDGPIKIRDVTPTAFHLMLRYAYGEIIGSDDVGGVENALDSLYCAKMYLIDKLANICRDRIQFHIATFREDPCVVFQRASQMDEEDLAGLALASIALNSSDVMDSDELLRLSFDCLKKIVDYPHLNATEPDIYRSVCRWVEHNVEAVQGWTLRDVCGSLLYSIRFPLFNNSESTEGPVADGILSPDETSSVFQFLLAEVKPVLPFLSTPRSPLSAPFICTFSPLQLNAIRHMTRFSRDLEYYLTKRILLEVRPDLAPQCCAFLRHLVEATLHIEIAFYIDKRPAVCCNVHPWKTEPLPTAVAEERSVLSHSVKGACWFEWDIEGGAACGFRIGVGRTPHPYHSAVFGYLIGFEDGNQWEPFELWDDRRLKHIDSLAMCLYKLS